HTVHLHGGSFGGGDFPVYALGAECDFRVAGALEDVFVHLAIAALVAAVAAGRVEYDFAGDLAGGGVEVQLAAFQVERSLHGVQHVAEGEVGGRLRRITAEN